MANEKPPELTVGKKRQALNLDACGELEMEINQKRKQQKLTPPTSTISTTTELVQDEGVALKRPDGTFVAGKIVGKLDTENGNMWIMQISSDCDAELRKSIAGGDFYCIAADPTELIRTSRPVTFRVTFDEQKL